MRGVMVGFALVVSLLASWLAISFPSIPVCAQTFCIAILCGPLYLIYYDEDE